jgi:copper(I)-binding protein
MNRVIAILLSAALFAASAAAGAGGVTVTDPWIREAPPGVTTLAGYLRISNASAAPVTLDAVTSADFGAIEIHVTEMHDGVMHMGRARGLEIGAGASRALEPGGAHLMLMDRKRPLRAGDAVTLRLRFSDGEEIDAHAPVRK